MTLAHFLESVFESFLHADGRLASTARALLTRPGELTAAYIRGAHKKYLGPVQLFLIVNLVYFLVQSLTGWNTFSTPLSIHVGDLQYRDLANSILVHRLASLHLTYQEFEPIFNHSAGLHAKSLVILMIPFFALPVGLLFWRRQRMIVPHLIFSSHYWSFNLLLLCVCQVLTSMVVWGLVKGGIKPSWQQVDNALTYVTVVIQAIYLFRASRKVYGQAWMLTVIKTTLLFFALSYVVLAFRFTLFLITLYFH